LALSGKSDKIPAEFSDIQLCEAMGVDYWTLMEQPARHLELFKMYLEVKTKINQQQEKDYERRVKNGRQKT
jgi:hypothetical protein